MKINEVQAKMGKIELTAEITEKGEPRTFEKFGKQGKVCDAQIKDESGTLKLTLWNEQCDQVSVGDMVKISNGYAGEYKGTIQLSTGKFGSLEVVGKAEPKPESEAKPAPDKEITEMSEELDEANVEEEDM